MRLSPVSGGRRRTPLAVLTLAVAASAALSGATFSSSQADAAPADPRAATVLGPATSYPVGGGPTSMAVADFNGDTVDDLAFTTDAFGVSVILGAADGTFAAATSIPILTGGGRIPTSVAAGDLNGDTVPDLVVGFGGIGLATSVQVMLGTGTGAFGGAVTFATATDPWAVVIGDFVGDDSPDIASANRVSGTVSVLTGDGTGSFAAAIGFPVGEYPTSIAAGDLNGDTRPDLVTANANTDDVSVLLTDGAGSFHPATNIAVGHYPGAVAIGPIDGGGTPDVAVADNIDGTVTVLLNDGAGVLDLLPPVATGASAGGVAIGDLNADSFVDLAVANYFDDTVSVLTGNGTGVLGSKTDHPSAAPSAVVIDAFGSDALADLAYANQDTEDVTVRLNTDDVVLPDLGVSPDTLDFGSQQVGTQSAARTVTVVNNGSAGVMLDVAGIAGDLRDDFPSVSSDCNGVLLPPGASCGLTIAFQPSAAGLRAAQIVIAPAVGDAIGVPISGTGVQAKIGKVAVTGPASVAKGKTATFTARITNTGALTATDVKLRVSGKGVSGVAQVGTIAAGQTTSVTVKLKPRKTGKIKTTFAVSSADAGGRSVVRTITVR